jgi:preprotein translocase subunit SecG
MDILSMILGIIFLVISLIAFTIFIVNMILYYNYKEKDKDNGDLHNKRQSNRKK